MACLGFGILVGVGGTLLLQAIIGLMWWFTLGRRQRLDRQNEAGYMIPNFVGDEESKQELSEDPGFLCTDEDVFTQSDREGDGEELSNEMKWRLDADATVEGGRFQWGWERYSERGDLVGMGIGLRPESAEIQQSLSRDYHICHKVSGPVDGHEVRYYLFAKLQFPPENLYLIELRVYFDEGKVEATVKSDCSCTKGRECTYCSSFLSYLRIAMRGLFSPQSITLLK